MQPYWQDDDIALYHADCLVSHGWLEADVLIVDPPYGQAYKSGQWGRSSSAATIHGDENTLARDEVLRAWGDKPAAVFGNWRVPRPANVKHRLLWHKEGRFAGVMGGNERVPWFPADEEIYILGTGWIGPPTPNIIRTKEARSQHATKIGHPTPKPLDLMLALIAKAPEGVIADPFAGSGSTLVAAQHAGRKAIGFEIEEKYCELAARRLAQAVLT